MSYQALVLLPADCNVDAEAAEWKLRETFPAMRVVREGERIVVSDGWEMRIDFSTESHVGVESREIVARFGADRSDAERLASADRRFEVSADPDPEMDHFNDYIFALETLTSFEGAAAFDPQSGEFV